MFKKAKDFFKGYTAIPMKDYMSPSGPTLISQRIKPDPNQHVLLLIERKDRPSISIDIDASNRGRSLSIRLDGYFIYNMNCDMEQPKSRKESKEPEETKPRPLHRYCVYCGSKIEFWSSMGHRCKEFKTEI